MALSDYIGYTALAASVICTIIASVSVDLVEDQIERANISDIGQSMGKIGSRATFWYMCTSSIALLGAMMIQHAYILLHIGPKWIFTRHIPPTVKHRPVFYLVLALYWVCFVGMQTILIIAMIKLWHEMPPKIYTFWMNIQMLIVQSATFALHFFANGIQSCLLGITRIDEYSSIAQDECVICIETPAHGEFLRTLPCQHEFHLACVNKWLLQKEKTCPLCRT